MSYDRYIPGISLSYDIDGHNPGIYQVYTTKFPSMGVPDESLPCSARPRHLAAASDTSEPGVGNPARAQAAAQPRPTRLSGHLDCQGPDSTFLVLAASGMQARAVQVLKPLGLQWRLPVTAPLLTGCSWKVDRSKCVP